MEPGRLFIVATPIGNLEDISERALRVLREVDRIAAEDTRHSKRLLAHYSIKTPLTSYHEHNEARKAEDLIRNLEQGRDLALITDAGTPCVSDPGYVLVSAAHRAKIKVIPIPGPSAPIAALSASGLPNDRFTFYGFFPRKKGRAGKLLKEIGEMEGTHIFFESPHRLTSLLTHVAELLPNASMCVTREMTKMFEEIIQGDPQQLLEHFSKSPVKGECVVILHVAASEVHNNDYSPDDIRTLVDEAMEQEGMTRRDAIKCVAKRLGLPRNRVYSAATGGDNE